MRDPTPEAIRFVIGCIVGLLVAGAGEMRAQQGVLRGVVTDSAGTLVPGADVGIAALRMLTRTDDSGRFTFHKLPIGALDLSVRRLGYAPRTVQLNMTAGAIDSVRILLTAQPAILAGVDVPSTRRLREMIEDFHRRRIRGVGAYVTRDQIEARNSSVASDMLRNMPGIRFVRVAGGKRGARFNNTTSISRRDCAPMIWIDGQRAPGMEIDDLPLTDIEGIELYNGPSTVPLQFSPTQSSNTCGAIVVWSRPPPPRRP